MNAYDFVMKTRHIVYRVKFSKRGIAKEWEELGCFDTAQEANAFWQEQQQKEPNSIFEYWIL